MPGNAARNHDKYTGMICVSILLKKNCSVSSYPCYDYIVHDEYDKHSHTSGKRALLISI